MLTTPQNLTRTDMPCANILPRTYYEHAVVGRSALDNLAVNREMIIAGMSRSSFIISQMELAATLDVSVRAVAKNSGRSVR